MGPGHLKDHLLPDVPAQELRSRGEALLTVPSVKETHLVGAQERTFSWPWSFISVALPLIES